MGGMHGIVEGMVKVAEEQGVRFEYNCEVEAILEGGGKTGGSIKIGTVGPDSYDPALMQTVQAFQPLKTVYTGLLAYKDETGNMVAISRGKVKDAKRQFAHQVQLRLCMQCNPNISVKVFKTGRLQVDFCCLLELENTVENSNQIPGVQKEAATHKSQLISINRHYFKNKASYRKIEENKPYLKSKFNGGLFYNKFR